MVMRRSIDRHLCIRNGLLEVIHAVCAHIFFKQVITEVAHIGTLLGENSVKAQPQPVLVHL